MEKFCIHESLLRMQNFCIGNHLNRTTWSSIWKYLSPRKCFSSKVSKFSSKLHEPVGGMRFEIFEKHTSTNKIQIEREKSYHYFLIIFIEKFTCLALFQPVWTARHSCSAIASKSCFDELNCLSPIKELVYPFSFSPIPVQSCHHDFETSGLRAKSH